MFETLVSAPSYYWNIENCKILLIFVTNCTKSEAIYCAGIRLDYKLLVSVSIKKIFMSVCTKFKWCLILFSFRLHKHLYLMQ